MLLDREPVRCVARSRTAMKNIADRISFGMWCMLQPGRWMLGARMSFRFQPLWGKRNTIGVWSVCAHPCAVMWCRQDGLGGKNSDWVPWCPKFLKSLKMERRDAFRVWGSRESYLALESYLLSEVFWHVALTDPSYIMEVRTLSLSFSFLFGSSRICHASSFVRHGGSWCCTPMLMS